MKMKKQLYLPLLITLLVSLIFGALHLGQPSIVYAAPDILYLLPDGPGDNTSVNIDVVGAASHWDAVNDPVVLPDDGATYIETLSTNWEYDTYSVNNTAQTGTINSVTVHFRYQCSKAKTHYFKPLLRLRGSETHGTVISHSTITWTDNSELLDRPGSGNWTWTDIDDLQVGIGLQDSGLTGNPQVTQVYVEVDYTPLVSISNTPSSYGFGVLAEGATANTTLTYFTVTNNGSSNVTITIGGTDMIGDFSWELSDTATPGQDPATYGLKAGLEGGSYNITVKKSPYNTLISNLADSSSQQWGLQLLAPTSFSGGGVVSGNVTLTATQA